MITINSITLNATATVITVDVSTVVGATFTEMLFYSMDAFTGVVAPVDLSNLLTGTGNTENLSFTVADVGLMKFSDLYFIKFKTNENIVIENCEEDSNEAIGVVANFTNVIECLVSSAQNMTISGCEEIIKKDGCASCNGTTFTLTYSTFELMKTVLLRNNFEEAIELYKKVKEFCNICNSCPDADATNYIIGSGYGVLNNEIIAI